MRKVLVALLSAIVVGLMLAMPVSAGKSNVVTIPDRTGDLGKYNVYIIVGGTRAVAQFNNSWGDNAPFPRVGYVDMVSESFGMLDKNTYVFGMELAANLPRVGDPLPPGIRYVGWQLWLEDSPWSPTNPAKTYWQVFLEFNGLSYSAGIWDWNTYTSIPLPFTIDGAKFQIKFSPDQIGNLESFWWSAGTYLAKNNIYAWPWITDLTDLGVAPDQVWFDLPWPHA